VDDTFDLALLDKNNVKREVDVLHPDFWYVGMRQGK
jgi:hypothetical protein